MESTDSKPFLKIKKQSSSEIDVKGSVMKVELKSERNENVHKRKSRNATNVQNHLIFKKIWPDTK